MSEAADRVSAWAEPVTIPTYAVGQPDRNPMFLEKRVYQGSSGAVYPYPVIDRVADTRHDATYTAVFLENRYLRVMLLPELGGRIQLALDKTNGYHFIYHNRVIKPALVGLTGPWISGGIEFNWPQHHRPSTFAPLDWRITTGDDGSATVWCAEVEQMSFTKGMHGVTLYPDRAYLEIRVQLFNRSAAPQSFLWWANPAVAVNEHYQSVFPPDVHAVMDHGKRDVSAFPIATGTYYKVNYAPGTDISRYSNIPAPTSYMAYHSDFDFVGDYDHGRQAGMLHVANHHLVPGKKQWTWGTSDFGQAWERQLTDEDGPYIELMCGAFTDNQPDFSWLMPGEEKSFTQVFLPYQQIGPAKNASRDVVLSLECAPQSATLGVYLTAPRQVQVALLRDTTPLWQQTAALAPDQPLLATVPLPPDTRPQQLTLRVCDPAGGHELLAFTPLPDERPPIPAPATPAPPPATLASAEELFLTGLHLEQYRHATYAPEPYYQEALRRDPLDSRCNNALGLLLYRRGQFAAAEAHFRRALERLTSRNPNPYDGEPSYNLGLALSMQGRAREAVDALFKATWNAAWQDAAFFELARLAGRAGQFDQALELASRALRRNWSHHQARHLTIALLRHAGRAAQARQTAALALELDPLDLGALWERWLLDADPLFAQSIRLTGHTAITLALDYAHAGLLADALTVLADAPGDDPLVCYLRADLRAQQGDAAGALEALRQAAAAPPDYCFPNRLECVPVLERAIRLNPDDPRAPYYLGNFWYAHRVYDAAIACWEQARALDPSFPTVQRNLGLAYVNQRHDLARGAESYARAFALDPDDARVLFELDQLEKLRNRPPAERLARLEQHAALVARRDDLTIERITLLNALGRHAEAYAILIARQFHPWEGGEGQATGQYLISLVGQARALRAAGQPGQAAALLQQALHFPPNLGEGRLPNAKDQDVFYELGRCWEALGDQASARACFERATADSGELGSPMYYNDQPPEMIFYQGLACHRLGRAEQAAQIFHALIDYGQTHLDDHVQIDYFAVSLPTFLVFDQDLTRRNQIHCRYLIALGQLGLGEHDAAQRSLAQVLALDANHQRALLFRDYQAGL